jgi:periplasmic protein TonB
MMEASGMPSGIAHEAEAPAEKSTGQAKRFEVAAVQIVQVFPEATARRSSRRRQVAAWGISVVIHAATLSALAAPFVGPSSIALLGGDSSVVSVELMATRADAAPEPVEDRPTIVRTETEPPAIAADVLPTERFAKASLSSRMPAAAASADRIQTPMASLPLLSKAERPSKTEPPLAPAAALPKRSRKLPTPILTAVAISRSIGFDRTLPRALDNPQPVYPEAAIANRWHGQVLLRLSVTEAGRVQRVEIAASSGVAVLDEAAVAAVRQWRFQPATQDSVPVGTSVLLPVVFELPRWALASGASSSSVSRSRE